MVDISSWMDAFLLAAEDTFGDRVWFVGLQGSYARGEAMESSDIDVVFILDSLTSADIQTYDAMLDTLPHREKVCGFLSGKEEILHWDPSDLLPFYYDTKPIRGSLDALLPLIDAAAVERAIQTGAGNVYHGCVHNLVHDKSDEMLRNLYKAAVFVVQAICYQQTGVFVSRHKDLLSVVSTEHGRIVEQFLALKEGEAIHFQTLSKMLFTWSQSVITEVR